MPISIRAGLRMYNLPEVDDFLAEQVAKIASHIAAKEYRGREIVPFDVKCVLQASIMLREEIDNGRKSEET